MGGPPPWEDQCLSCASERTSWSSSGLAALINESCCLAEPTHTSPQKWVIAVSSDEQWEALHTEPLNLGHRFAKRLASKQRQPSY
jgi:hypothetical protein